MKLAVPQSGFWEQDKRILIVAAIFSFCFAIGFSYFRGLSLVIDDLLFLFAVVFFLCSYGMRKADRYTNVLIAILSLVLAFFQIAAYMVRTPSGAVRDWTIFMLLPILVMAIMFFPILRGLAVLCGKLHFRKEEAKGAVNRRIWLLFFILIVVCWLPSLLALGPRISADSTWVLGQAFGVTALDDAHPLLYTLLVKLIAGPFYAAGNPTLGVYLFCFLQLCAVAAAMAYMLFWLKAHGCPVWFYGLGLAYFCMSTVLAVNSITIWKDILFNAVLLLLILYLYDVVESGGLFLQTRKGLLHYVVLSLATCFLRGNGWPIILLFTVLLVLVYRKKVKHFLVIMAVLLVLVKVVTGPVYNALGVSSSLGVQESAALPIQQVGRVVAVGGDITEQQRAFLDQILDTEIMAEVYRTPTPDYIKGHSEFDQVFFNEHFGEFIQVWLEMAPHNLVTYLNAWLLETVGYWHIGFRETSGAYGNEYDNVVLGIQHKDLLTPMLGFDVAEFYRTNYRHLSIAFMAWLVVFVAVLSLIRRQSKMLIPLSVFLIVWVGMLFGAPSYNEFRYMLVFAYALPAVFYMLCCGIRQPLANAKQQLQPNGAEVSS